MIFPAGLEGVIPLSPGATVTREFQLVQERFTVTISRDEGGFYELTMNNVTQATPREVGHVSEILTENDLDGIYRALITTIR
jgi:hypothetical protein